MKQAINMAMFDISEIWTPILTFVWLTEAPLQQWVARILIFSVKEKENANFLSWSINNCLGKAPKQGHLNILD